MATQRTKWPAAMPSPSDPPHAMRCHHAVDGRPINCSRPINPYYEPSNAFEGIASSSTSASNKVRYEVFINHRGIDTKHTLATSIYNALNGIGLKVFLDEKELQLGDFITAEIEEAMRTSLIHIAIFSPRYAESPWCLAELSYMLKTGTRIIPVFYDVDPSDPRYLKKGPFADAFAEHEEKKRYAPEKLAEWKEALSNISFRHGQVLKGKSE
ncbi:probable 2' cyclic ADP-D-ribose synthase BdTIR [Cryptomeria japonica]|uniref:probable 2' cyclic ADP-D-ribose synthase BdTIR n=1 Tax=Cryptomeria japonica TaxID=3369 RepID=UPI0027DA5F5D|nr:probable 2' cyclic ADP-D-ribose synthase BdTIR [Cryptomeria japonica]